MKVNLYFIEQGLTGVVLCGNSVLIDDLQELAFYTCKLDPLIARPMFDDDSQAI